MTRARPGMGGDGRAARFRYLRARHDLHDERLIGQLEGIRARTFYRISDEALSDVEITNAVLNGLRYRRD